MHSLLTCRVPVVRSAVSLMGIPLYIISCFSPIAFNCFLCVYISLVWLICLLACFSLGSSCMGVSGFLDLGGYFLSHIREAFIYNLLKCFLIPFLFLFLFWELYNFKFDALNVTPEVSVAVFISFYFFFVLLCFSYFYHSFFFFICSEFCHTLEWNSHGFTCVPHPDRPSHLPLHLLPLGFPSAPGPSTCLMHPTWAGDLFHPRYYTCFDTVLLKHPTLSFSHRV